jgi:hypothetical protein
VVVDSPQGPAEVDARPSDALNLALVVGAGAGGRWGAGPGDCRGAGRAGSAAAATGRRRSAGACAIVEELLSADRRSPLDR